MHAIMFIPAAIFCAVTAVSVLVVELIERRAAAGVPAPAAGEARPRPRLILIQGGRAAPWGQPPLPAARSRLRSAGTAQAARSA